MKNNQFHTDFKLNGKSFEDTNELLAYSKQFSNVASEFLALWFSESDVLEVQTSGSTGVPKIIKLRKKFMINSALATGVFFNLKANTTALLCLSPEYIAGKMMLVRALVLGWNLDVIDSISAPLKTIDKRYDFSAMVPMQLQNSLEELYKVRKLIVGGGVVSKELECELQNCNTEVFATYGMTETITHIAVRKLNNFLSLRREITKQSIYRTLPNIIISQDNRGCLIINAPKVSKKEIITNDVVRLISENEFEWLGRFDNVINSGGIKLHPEKIEEKLSEIIKTRFFVIGVPDTILGEQLILLIEGAELNTVFEKIKSLNTLSKYETPKAIYFVKEFVETETKKIQRSKTAKLLALSKESDGFETK